MSNLERAIEIAARAHQGQLDHGGSPYILHCLRVMMQLQGDMDAMIVGVLHDVIEDTDITIQDLQNEGFSEEITSAILALTKQKNENRIQAARRAAENQIALKVKLADNSDNMDLSRIPNPTPWDYELMNRYAEVRKLLLDAAASKQWAWNQAITTAFEAPYKKIMMMAIADIKESLEILGYPINSDITLKDAALDAVSQLNRLKSDLLILEKGSSKNETTDNAYPECTLECGALGTYCKCRAEREITRHTTGK